MRRTNETEVRRLRRDCAEAYQVIGALAATASLLNHPDVISAMDNLAASVDGLPRPHDNLLPFPKQPLTKVQPSEPA
jgi:hypothetical protein